MVWRQALRNWGQLGRYGAAQGVRNIGMLGTPTGIGAIAGGAWGMVSDDTSVLGGALMGGLGGRYGYSAMRRGLLGRRGIGVGRGDTYTGAFGFGVGAAKGLVNRTRMDFRGASLMANGIGKTIRSSLKD